MKLLQQDVLLNFYHSFLRQRAYRDGPLISGLQGVARTDLVLVGFVV